MSLFHWMRKKERPPEPTVNLSLGYQVGTVQGLGTRENQEDSYGGKNISDIAMIQKEGLFLAVSDGMGGMAEGEKASKTVISSLLSDFPKMNRSYNLGEQLRDMAVRAGENVYRQLHGNSGATLVSGMIYREMLYWVSVGDSFIFLKRRNSIYQINQPQNSRTEQYKRIIRGDVLSSAEADEDREGDRLSSFLGMPALAVAPEYNLEGMRLLNGDDILLCSDGVGGVLREQEITSCLEEDTPAKACSKLDHMICEKKKKYQDNYTAMLIRCQY